MASPNTPDRKLGDEWEDWDGSLHENDTRTPGWVFLALAGLAGLMLAGLGLLVTWLVYPRMQSLGMGPAVIAACGLWSVYLASWYAGVIFTAWGLPLQRLNRLLGGVSWIVTPAIYLGKLFGLSRDKLGHSFLLNYNRFELFPRVQDPVKLLVLAPRCLSRDTMQELRRMQEQYRFSLVVAVGGTEARRAIGEIKPKGIIAIACERDLLSGVKDIRGRVPVWTLPNTRPEGPCKNTMIPIREVEQMVVRFLAVPGAAQPSCPGSANGI